MRFVLDLPPGLVSDETTFASPGRFADGNNVRFRDGKPETIGGWTEAFATAVTGTCRNVLAWIDQSGQQNIAFGTHSKLMVLKANALSDITPSGLTAGNADRTELGYGQGGYGQGGYGGGALSEFFPRTWSLANWGQNLMAAPRNRALYIWTNDSGSDATEVTQAPDHISSMLVNQYRQVMAFGCEEVVSGTFNQMCIRGSDFEDYTAWTPTTSNNAFEHILEGGGRIVRGAPIGPYIAIWTDTSLFLGQYTGNAVSPWRFDLMADNCGLAGPNAAVVVNQRAYWLTPDLQFYAYQVGAAPAPMYCPIGKDFRDNLDTYEIDKIVCASVSKFDEIWWHYPDSRDTASGASGENSRYLSVKATDPAVWSKGVMARTAMIDSGPLLYPLAVDTDAMILYHENGDDANGAALDWFIQTGDSYFNEAGGRMLARGAWPDIEAQTGNISLTLYTKSFPQAEPRAKGPWTLAPGREKRDFMVEGRIFSAKWSGSAAGTFARFGKPSFDVVAAGEF